MKLACVYFFRFAKKGFFGIPTFTDKGQLVFWDIRNKIKQNVTHQM